MILGVFAKAFADGMRPIKDLSLSEFAEQYIYNPPNSADAGKFSIHRAPYQKAIMDALTPNNGINKVVFMAGARIGKTFIANLWQGHIFAINPQNFICYEPTITLAEDYSSSQVNSFIDSSPILREIFEKGKGKNSVARKEYKGCMAYYKGANSGNSFRQIAAPYIYADEIDSYDFDVDGEGNPLKLIDNRASTYGKKKKIFLTSTPTIKDYSAIEKEFLKGNQQYFHVPCPHCKAKQVLRLPQLRYEINNETNEVVIGSVYYECQVCERKITEDKKTYMLLNGEWIAEKPDANPEIASFHISSLYSPLGWYSWEQMAIDWVEAKDDEFSRKSFINTKLGETYYEKSDQPSSSKLKARAEDYPLYEVNEKAVVLYAGVDTQPDRLCILVIAIGEEGETYTVAYDEVPGSPSDIQTWEALDRIVKRPFKHKSGVDLYIRKVAIDTGGKNTTDVYDFVRRNQDKYWAIKGASNDIGHYIKESQRIDFDKKTGKKLTNPLVLYLVNTQLIKKYIYLNLNMMLTADKKEGPKVIHFSNELQTNFYEMLTAEKLLRRVVNGVLKEEWINPKKQRNEVLDCLVYAYSMAFMDEMQRLYGNTYKSLWDINIGKRLELLEKKEKEEQVNNNIQNVPLNPRKNNSWINKGGWSLK